jgi:signal peptidase I
MSDEPRSGDLIAFLPPGISRPWLKRVIGNPGDTISLVRGRLYINGSTVDEPYVADANNALPCDLQERVVPDGMLFVLGDNRDRSKDSRHFGFIPRVNVIGKVTGS